MKRLLVCAFAALLLFAIVGESMVWAQGNPSTSSAMRIRRTLQNDQRAYDSFRVLSRTGVSQFRIDMDGNLILLDDSGVTDWYIPRDKIVVINRASQLSSYTGQQTAGQSHYQTAPGKTYIVDPWAIYRSGVTDGNGVSAFAKTSFTGVSLILPDASIYSGPAFDVTVRVAITGATGWGAVFGAATGTTMVQVWPYAGMAGLTAYGQSAEAYDTAYRSACTPQTLATFSHVAQSGGTIYYANHNMASGASWWMLDRPGESTTFTLYDSQVSAYPVSWSLTN